ncbi:uncharacterized protein LOC119398926 [Rhipicephalus sanguineus]|uniref:uncharacterized protein LOC119398926 n=1 Tax=Rhipicephalus sanguineus TaxID=34632 RepID=UPI001894E4D3|nr:uncharacterized protein LOC119398926 [Rhipicephalus sanguineus]
MACAHYITLAKKPALSLRSLHCTKWQRWQNLGQCCQLIQWLPIWNRVLAYSGLQLRELTAPGELSLVRIAQRGDQHELHGRDARLLFHALLSQHRCVVSVHLDDVLVEGCELRECRDRVILTLRQNASLRSLSLRSLFNDYKFIQEDLFVAIGTATQLQRLDITASGEVVPCLVDSLCSLLYTACLSTLSISALRFDEQTTERLLDALRVNTTLVDLSLHSSVLRCRNSADVPKFCSYLASQASLWHLALHGTDSEPEQTCKEIGDVLAVLAEGGNLQTMKLSGFIMDSACACALSRLVARHDGSLRQLDIGGCRLISDDSSKSAHAATNCDQPSSSSPEQTLRLAGPVRRFLEAHAGVPDDQPGGLEARRLLSSFHRRCRHRNPQDHFGYRRLAGRTTASVPHYP